MNYNLAQSFFESAQKYPEKLALFVDQERYSYSEMLDHVIQVAGWLSRSNRGSPKRVGIFGSRSFEACISILGAAWMGDAYVPISVKQPERRVADLLNRSGLDALIVDRTASQMLTAGLLKKAPPEILCHRGTVPAGIAQNVTYFDELTPPLNLSPPVVLCEKSLAYVLYTSGTTGTPKGVMVSCGAVNHLLNAMDIMYPICNEDRVAETTEISFDLSVYNMFATWRAGASLHVIPPEQAMAPAKFVQEHQNTVWLSVPSIPAFMSRMGLLKPGTFPSLKYTFFCGEPLLTTLAEAWKIAAPNSVVINMYGPTEATVMCIGQESSSLSIATRDCVAIGRPFPGMRAAIAEEKLKFATSGTPGELLLAGPQLSLGYLDDPEITAARFVTIDGERWYKTGDVGYCDEDGIFHYLYRLDNQVKILGHRVELEEIECHLRDSTGCTDVAAVAWPFHAATGVVAFLVNYKGAAELVKAAMQERVPSYMVPTRFHALPELPLNNNGKVDRNALQKILEEEMFV
jgi:amino acid adenylation domain-containing protein